MNGFSLFISELGGKQLHVTATVESEMVPATKVTENIYRELSDLLNERHMQIMQERVFGTLEFYEDFTRIRKGNFIFEQNPFTYVEGKPCRGKALAGVQIHAVKAALNADHWTIRDENLPCGHGWKRNNTTYICLSGISGLKSGVGGRKEQTALMLDKIHHILQAQHVHYSGVVRTWIYLSDILDWYDEFNRIRTDKFKEYNVIANNVSEAEIDHIYLPASTGVGGNNPSGASVVSDVWAITGDVQITVLQGGGQRSAYRYGSAFSRGLCVQEKGSRQLLVSGTAAIDDHGNSLYAGDVAAQMERTIESVEALISTKGANLTDIRAATVFLKKPGDLNIFKKVAKQHGVTKLPAVFVLADVCREELLFEMDALATVNYP